MKIAILDTGAHISSEQLETVYDGRVRECRTWLGSDKGGGDCLPGATSDRDGHGTHGTSVLLKATQATDIEVYVGQIFDKRTEKVKQDSILDDLTIRRIENASGEVHMSIAAADSIIGHSLCRRSLGGRHYHHVVRIPQTCPRDCSCH